MEGNPMKSCVLGNSDLQVPHICLGTMTFGQQNSEAEAHAQLDYALSQGLNFIDTAEMYPVPARADTSGLTEKFVGSWLKQQSRNGIILATKATGPGRSFDWIRNGQLHFTRSNLQQALHGSLQRLQTDYVDLYQLHWPDRNVPVFGGYHFDPEHEREAVPLQESLSAMADFIQAGKIRHWGLSNETPWGLMTVLRLADEMGLPRPITVQNAYNLLNRTWENGLSEVAYRENISLLAYSPLGFGHLSGKYHSDPKATGRVNLFQGFTARYNKPNTAQAVAAYVELSRQHNLTPTQLALGFTYNKWCVASTIIGATSMDQLRENLEVDQVQLDAEVLAEIERIHLHFPNPAP
jgi:aryl-alcohol dehydrogenase-like predicted oxidoreductase